MDRYRTLLTIGIAGIALLTGCTEADESSGLDADPTDTTPQATATLGTEPTDTLEPSPTETTETGAPTEEPTDGETVVLEVSVDGLLASGVLITSETVEAGTTVELTNATESVVTIEGEDAEVVAEVEPGATAEHTFTSSGIYTIMVEGEARGTIDVTE